MDFFVKPHSFLCIWTIAGVETLVSAVASVASVARSACFRLHSAYRELPT